MGSNEVTDDVPRRVDRRTLLRRAAAAGAAAWTTPAIIDSLTSPAGAVTGFVPKIGCTFVVFNSNCGPNMSQIPCNAIANCTAEPALAGCLTATCNPDRTVTVTNNCGGNCYISAAQAGTGGVNCVPPEHCNGPIGAQCCTGATGACTPATANSVTWDPPAQGNYAQFTVFLTCV